jgi:hypothetical protein
MKHNLMIQLDCILDTRLAVLGSYDPEIPKAIVSSKESFEKYRTRLVDDWSEQGVDSSKFRELWKQRDETHLRASSITPFVFELTDLIQQVFDQAQAAPHTISGFDLIVNYHPYKNLTTDELEAIESAIRARLKQQVKIDFICVPIKDLNPVEWDRLKIATAIMYDFDEWLTSHFGEGNEDKIESYERPRNSIYAPALFTSLEKLKELRDFENPAGKKADPLESIQFWMKTYFHLEYLGAEHFSLLEPDLFVAMELHNATIRDE